jgi:hypothetical protein
MLQRMSAEILFPDPNAMNACVAELIERDFEVELLPDLIDPCGPTVWIYARVITDIEEDDFLDWMQGFVEPFGGDVYEAGLDTPKYRAHLGLAPDDDTTTLQ